MLFRRETTPINANKANKENEHHNCRNRDNRQRLPHRKHVVTRYELQVYLKEKQPFFIFQFLFLFMVCIIVLMLSF